MDEVVNFGRGLIDRSNCLNTTEIELIQDYLLNNFEDFSLFEAQGIGIVMITFLHIKVVMKTLGTLFSAIFIVF